MPAAAVQVYECLQVYARALCKIWLHMAVAVCMVSCDCSCRVLLNVLDRRCLVQMPLPTVCLQDACITSVALLTSILLAAGTAAVYASTSCYCKMGPAAVNDSPFGLLFRAKPGLLPLGCCPDGCWPVFKPRYCRRYAATAAAAAELASRLLQFSMALQPTAQCRA